MEERQSDLMNLLEVLLPQTQRYKEKIEVLIDVDRGEKSIGKKRQDLIDRAKGDYVNFIDDDDMIAEDYVEQILPHLYYNYYIGFKVQYYYNGKPQKITIHDAEIDGVWEDENAYYRDFSHLNPITKKLALLGRFSGGNKEDDRWAKRLREEKAKDPKLPKPHRKFKNSRFIDKVLYYYYHNTEKTMFKEKK